MKTKFRNICIVFLAALMCFGSFACSCSDDDENAGDVTNGKPTNTVTEPAEHFVTNGLHKVKVTETSNPFVVNGETKYKIVYGSAAADQRAAVFIQGHVAAATGVKPIVTATAPSKISASDQYIVINVPSLFEAAGLRMPTEDIGQTGYYVKTVGKSVYISTLSPSGSQYGAIAFLKHVLGYEMYSEDTVVYEKKGDTMPDMEIVEKPDFEFHVQGNRVSSEARYGMGFMSTGALFIPVEGEAWHNSFNYLPPAQYKEAHPGWYNVKGTELCYTARGDEEEWNIMVDTIAEKMLVLSDQMPNIPNITLTIEDHNDNCSCSACSDLRARYDGADSAGAIKLINAVNRKVQAGLQQRAEESGTPKRTLNLLFFAYNKMEKPPVKRNAEGKWVPIDETVVCDEEVGVYIAPIGAAYNQSFYHDDNASAKSAIEGWAALSSKLYMWLYETNYSHYLYPINSYDTMIETYRFCKSQGAIFMMNEGQYNQGHVTHFSKLKEYLNARAEFDVNDNFADITDDFFKNYFMDAEPAMRQFFDELQAHLRYLEIQYPGDVNGNIYNPMEQTKLWPRNTLTHWIDLVNEGYAAIEKYRETDPALYNRLREHVLLESIFPRFALIRLHAGSFSAQTLQKMREEFRDDCALLSISMRSETSSLDGVFSAWGL